MIDLIPFFILLTGFYWVKVNIDSRVGLGKKKKKELKMLILEALNEWDQSKPETF